MEEIACYESSTPAVWKPQVTPRAFSWAAIASAVVTAVSGALSWTVDVPIFSVIAILGVCFTPTLALGWCFFSALLLGVNDEKEEALARWAALVPAGAYAPQWPLEGFSVLAAEQEVQVAGDGSSTLVFQARLNQWNDNSWVPGELIALAASTETTWTAGAGVEEIAAAWFDYTEAVKAANEQRYELEFVRHHSSDAAELRSVKLALTA
jgi:hypothetical protein